MKQCLDEVDVYIFNEQLQQLFDRIDENGSDLIEYQEFIRNACDIKTLMSESNLKHVFHAICGDKDIMTGEDIKKFVFHDSIVHEQTLNKYFEQIGMKIENNVNFEDFFNMIKINTKLMEKVETKPKSKKKNQNKHLKVPLLWKMKKKLKMKMVQ